MNIKMITGTEEELKHYIERSDDEINYYMYQMCDVLYFNILVKVSMLHKKYAINKKISHQERYNLALLKECEYNEIVKDIYLQYENILKFNNPCILKIKDLLSITKRNINYRTYNSRMYLIKNA